MTSLGKTIRLFLVDGAPSGLMTAEIMNWTGKVLCFPRLLLPQALRRPEIAKTGVYFLVGPDPDQFGRSLVYIGESDDVAKRLKQHDGDEAKDFFEQVALVVSKDENLTKAHVRYLESRLIDLTKQAAQAKLFNGTQGFQASLPESETSDMEYVLQQLQVLLPVLGLNFLQPPPKRPLLEAIKSEREDDAIIETTSPMFELSYLGGRIHAKAYEQSGQFVVMAGSTFRHPDHVTPWFKATGHMAKMQNLVAQHSLAQSPDLDPDLILSTENISFSSPSGAATMVVGKATNGRDAWRIISTGQTYNEWRQAQLDAIQPVELEPEMALAGVR